MARLHVDVHLAPGELGVYRKPQKVKTVLGSCVAVCLWDAQLRIAGLNHFILPAASEGETGFQFGTVACRGLIERMRSAGCRPDKLWAAVIGGGAPLGPDGVASVGAGNARVALASLAEHGIRVQRCETGGQFGRKLLFDTGNGDLLVRRLEKQLFRPTG